jgi:hypothetical protein
LSHLCAQPSISSIPFQRVENLHIYIHSQQFNSLIELSVIQSLIFSLQRRQRQSLCGWSIICWFSFHLAFKDGCYSVKGILRRSFIPTTLKT